MNNIADIPFDTGVDTVSDREITTAPAKRNATNAELVARQIKLILPLLPQKDVNYLASLSCLLTAGLGNRRV